MMQTAAVPSFAPLSELVAAKTLVVREGCALSSEVVEPSVSMGQVVVVLQTSELPDGTHRALVLRQGHAVASGWVTSMHKEGAIFLVPRGDRESAHLEHDFARAKARAAAAKATAVIADTLALAAAQHTIFTGLAMPEELHPRSKSLHGSQISSLSLASSRLGSGSQTCSHTERAVTFATSSVSTPAPAPSPEAPSEST